MSFLRPVLPAIMEKLSDISLAWRLGAVIARRVGTNALLYAPQILSPKKKPVLRYAHDAQLDDL